MIWLLLVILLIVAIVAISRSGKKNKTEVEKLQMEMTNIKKAPSPVEQKTQPVNVTDELVKLKQLLDAGAITAEEFEAQKKRVLGN